MTKKAFDAIAEGLREALDIAKGAKKPHKLFVPPEIDVRAIRESIGLSQEDFAAAFGFSLSQIRDWEQVRSRPNGSDRAYLMLVRDEPVRVLKMLRKAAKAHLAA